MGSNILFTGRWAFNWELFLGFHLSCDQNQNRNNSINFVMNLGYDR